METKSIFKSKTFWVNLIAFALAIFALIDPSFLGGFGVKPEAQTKVLTVIGSITAVLNIALRFISTGAVSLMGVTK